MITVMVTTTATSPELSPDRSSIAEGRVLGPDGSKIVVAGGKTVGRSEIIHVRSMLL